MRKTMLALMAAAGMLWTMQASAAFSLDQWGATARTDSADCTAGCSIFTIDLMEGEVDGGSQHKTASIGSAAGSAVGLEGRGQAGAEVVIPNSGLQVPVLRARADSVDANGWVGGTAFGLQGYQFSGADGTPVSIDAFLSGTVSNPSASALTGLSVDLWVLKDTVPFVFPAEPVPVAELVAQIVVDAIFAGESDPFIATLAWDFASTGTGSITRNTTDTDPGDQLNFTLNDGQGFYLMSALQAGADGIGASAFSWSTLEMEITADGGQLLASSPVPLPASVWLFGSALLGLYRFARSRHRGA